ncbi:MAG: outer membrane beta-barrel protein [Xanthobacteraceae bacterium]|nr:outer membrane beta-barrel protein [Xanthobacteraceae bacterium]
MKNIRIIFGLLLAVCATSALAQPAPVYNWTGFYIGVHGGYLSGENKVLNFLDTSTVKPDGAFGGVQIGYWAPLSANWLYGFEADLSFSDADGFESVNGITTRFDRFGTARTRIGYANGQWLFFASGGVAWARISSENIPSSLGTLNTKQGFKGWTAGAGVEYALSQRWSVRAEYLYADFGKNSVNLLGDITELEPSFSLVRVGLNYRLGDVPRSAPQMQTRSAFNWTGGYIGVHGGYASGDQSMTFLAGTVLFEPKGGFGGVQGGFNWQFASNLVLGIESDISFGKIEGNFDAGCCVVKIDRFGTARLRAGYAINNALFYGTGGIAWAKTDNQYFFSLITSDRPFIGWTAGAGVEYAFSPMWSIKAEYLRFEFGDNKSDYVGLTPFDERAHYDLFRIGLNYRASVFEILARR